MNALKRQMDSARSAQKNELARLQKERGNIIRAIKDGVPADLVKAELTAVAARQKEIEEQLADEAQAPRPLLHPHGQALPRGGEKLT